MIVIINDGPSDGDPGGVRNYTLQINDEVLVTFMHERRQGLAACLREAAEAWEMEEMRKAVEYYHEHCVNDGGE